MRLFDRYFHRLLSLLTLWFQVAYSFVSRGGRHAFAVTLVPLFLLSAGSVLAAGVTFDVDTNSGCVDRVAVRKRVAPLFAPYAEAQGGAVIVVARRAGSTTNLVIRVVAVSGEVVLERRATLRPEDCPSASELVATILERFLRDFPRTQWTEIARSGETTVILVGNGLPWIAGTLRASAGAHYPGFGVDIEVAAALETGTARQRLYASAIGRASTPMALGVGRFIDGATLLGLGWKSIGPAWVLEVELRAGARLLNGYNYERNRSSWLPYGEVAAGMAWSANGWLFGPTIAVSPLSQHATTAAGARTALPWLRLGLGVWVPIGTGLL